MCEGSPRFVCTSEEAYQCFIRTEMDYLVIGNFLLNKVEQPLWKEGEDWQKQLRAD